MPAVRCQYSSIWLQLFLKKMSTYKHQPRAKQGSEASMVLNQPASEFDDGHFDRPKNVFKNVGILGYHHPVDAPKAI